jgi:hypothetical protein
VTGKGRKEIYSFMQNLFVKWAELEKENYLSWSKIKRRAPPDQSMELFPDEIV